MIRCLAASLAAFLVMIASPVLAQDAAGNLVGTWTMTDFIGRSWNGTKINPETFKSFELEISQHDGPILVGTWRWQFIDDRHQLHDGEQVTSASEEDVVGVRDFDGTYVLVEHPDTSTHRLRVTGPDSLEMLSYESGPNAAVGFATLKRQ